jgi:hypothetical protein
MQRVSLEATKMEKINFMLHILKNSTFLKIDIVPGGIKQSHVGAPWMLVME